MQAAGLVSGGAHQKPTTGLSFLASASRSALVSITGAAERADDRTGADTGAVGAKERAAAAVDSIARAKLSKEFNNLPDNGECPPFTSP